jgi:hypothetical protein
VYHARDTVVPSVLGSVQLGPDQVEVKLTAFNGACAQPYVPDYQAMLDGSIKLRDADDQLGCVRFLFYRSIDNLV